MRSEFAHRRKSATKSRQQEDVAIQPAVPQFFLLKEAEEQVSTRRT
jgi:hypothetical protein